MAAPRLAKRIGANNLYIKNDAVCLPTLSFKDRVVAVALANAQAFGFDTVGCSSTGNLANAVAAGAARLGLKTYILVPADLEPAKILNTQVYGATLIRIDGNYDHCNRLCSQIAEKYNWGFVNVNLRPYYAEGSKTVGFEIAEQLGWRLPDNVVVPMAGGSLITKIQKAFKELVALGLVEKTSRSASSARRPPDARRSRLRSRTARMHRAAAAQHHRALAGHRQSRGRSVCDSRHSRLGRLG
jgi:threonine synthase